MLLFLSFSKLLYSTIEQIVNIEQAREIIKKAPPFVNTSAITEIQFITANTIA